MTVAVIPARGGSKRLPNKNIRPFRGAPMLTWPIQAARDSGVITDIRVSTDDDTIAKVARDAGAEAAGTRPAALSDDHATLQDVMAYECQRLIDEAPAGAQPDWVVLIYATAALLPAHHLAAALETARAAPPDLDFLGAVVEFPAAVERALSADARGRLSMPANVLRTRTQDLKPHYYDPGQFLIGRLDAWAHKRPIWQGTTAGYILPQEYCVDIDTEADWSYAEIVASALLDRDAHARAATGGGAS